MELSGGKVTTKPFLLDELESRFLSERAQLDREQLKRLDQEGLVDLILLQQQQLAARQALILQLLNPRLLHGLPIYSRNSCVLPVRIASNALSTIAVARVPSRGPTGDSVSSSRQRAHACSSARVPSGSVLSGGGS